MIVYRFEKYTLGPYERMLQIFITPEKEVKTIKFFIEREWLTHTHPSIQGHRHYGIYTYSGCLSLTDITHWFSVDFICALFQLKYRLMRYEAIDFVELEGRQVIFDRETARVISSINQNQIMRDYNAL